MTRHPVELTDVIFNSTTQAFEARAFVRDPEGEQSYACAIEAPITTEFEQAAKLLVAQALRRHMTQRPHTVLPQSRFAPLHTNVPRLERAALSRLWAPRAA